MNALHICPVCELPVLLAPPEMGPVCPACGTEFEVDDRYRSKAEIRQDWLDNGAQWFSSRIAPPPNWGELRMNILAKSPARHATAAVEPVVAAVDWQLMPLVAMRATA